MSIWIVKAILQKLMGITPFGFRLNYFFQKYVTKRVLISDDFFETMLSHFADFQSISQESWGGKDKVILELGTGWHPVLPLCFVLHGARRVDTIDLRGLIRTENLKSLLIKFLDYHSSGKLTEFLPQLRPDVLDAFENALSKLDSMPPVYVLRELGVFQIIGLIQEQHFTDEYDLVYSVNVLEHVSATEVSSVVSAMYRAGRTGSLGFHAIGTYDHFVHVDRNISKFNYLKFSARAWNLIDNPIQPQNRLRLSYFEDQFTTTGFNIEQRIFWDGEPQELEKIKIHKDFRNEKYLDVPYGSFCLRKA